MNALIQRVRSLDQFRRDKLPGLGDGPVRTQLASTSAYIQIGMTEDAQAYTIRASVPGLTTDDILVSVEGNRVTFRAEMKRQGSSSVLSSSLRLGAEIDPSAMQSHYEQGVLTLTLPKQSASANHTLRIA